MKENIVLVGFMGVGKGQVARQLAIGTGMFAVDCDDLIESMTNLKIRKIFADHGEQTFRELEKKTAKWLEKKVKSTIISTGGGFANVPNIEKLGHVIYLHAEFDYIIEKISSHPNSARKLKKRPLLQDLHKAQRLYNKRLPLYRKVSGFEVDVTGKQPSVVALEIAHLLELSINTVINVSI